MTLDHTIANAEPHRVLFLCVANSARSQMAEAIARQLDLPDFAFFSAGSVPTKVHPHAVAVMAEIGVSMDKHRSKHVDTMQHLSFDTVITLCKEEYCPTYLGDALKLHWPFEDPAAGGDELSTRESFRNIRDAIHQKLRMYFLSPHHPTKPTKPHLPPTPR